MRIYTTWGFEKSAQWHTALEQSQECRAISMKGFDAARREGKEGRAD